MLLSFCLLIMPIANIASAFGPTGANSKDPSSIPFWGTVAGLCVFITGTMGVLVGYMATVHDWSHRYLTIPLMVAIQTAWVGYITDLVAVSKGSKMPAETNGFIPLAYDPEDIDVKFVGSMGIIGIMCYGFAFVGSMAFMVWSLHAYATGEPGSHGGNYYRGRMSLYSKILAVAGLVQFLLGVWCQARFDMNILEDGPVTVAFFVITYPGISIYIGLFQIFNGIWGIARARGYLQVENVQNIYQLSLAFQWINVLVLQDLVQISYAPGGMLAPVAPTVAAFTLGLSLMPAYLDHKMVSLPEEFEEGYYGESCSAASVEANNHHGTDKCANEEDGSDV